MRNKNLNDNDKPNMNEIKKDEEENNNNIDEKNLEKDSYISDLLIDYSKKENGINKFIKKFKIGKLVFYSEIFGFNSFINIAVENENFLILDSYCPVIDCDCTEISLKFFKEKNMKISKNSDFSFFYDYLNRDIKQESIDNYEKIKNKILPVLNAINDLFKNRHKEIKEKLGPPILQKQNENLIKELKRKQIKNWKSEKIGRNEPCPCGSGKKYKKCCLNMQEE